MGGERKKIVRKRRRAPPWCARHKQPHLKRGESFIHSSKSTVIFALFSCIPASVGQCHCPRQGCRSNRADGLTGIPGRAAVRRPCADGTVTRNASPASGGRITTTLVQLLLLPLPLSTRARGVAAPRRRRKRGEERRLVASRRNSFGKLVWMLDRHSLRLRIYSGHTFWYMIWFLLHAYLNRKCLFIPIASIFCDQVTHLSQTVLLRLLINYYFFLYY